MRYYIYYILVLTAVSNQFYKSLQCILTVEKNHIYINILYYNIPSTRLPLRREEEEEEGKITFSACTRLDYANSQHKTYIRTDRISMYT